MSSVKREAIVIGASAGGIGALSEILPQLPANYPLPTFIVVHIPPDMKSLLPELFASKCRVQVKEAEDKETIRPGVVYFAPPDYHLLVETTGLLSLSSDEPELFSRPSINVLFESAEDAYGTGLVGIILTGASNDGAKGLHAISKAGGLAIVQDPKTAESSHMPESALESCPGALTLTSADIGALLARLPNDGKTDGQ
jgi:two-component system chemotaxis response regulator CheB